MAKAATTTLRRCIGSARFGIDRARGARRRVPEATEPEGWLGPHVPDPLVHLREGPPGGPQAGDGERIDGGQAGERGHQARQEAGASADADGQPASAEARVAAGAEGPRDPRRDRDARRLRLHRGGRVRRGPGGARDRERSRDERARRWRDPSSLASCTTPRRSRRSRLRTRPRSARPSTTGSRRLTPRSPQTPRHHAGPGRTSGALPRGSVSPSPSAAGSARERPVAPLSGASSGIDPLRRLAREALPARRG